MTLAGEAGTADHVVMFGSTSKITYAGAGLGFVAATETVLTTLEQRLGTFSIGPDKVNHLRHVQFFGDADLEPRILAMSLVGTLVRRIPEDLSVMNKFWHAVVQKRADEEGGPWVDFLAGGKEAMELHR